MLYLHAQCELLNMINDTGIIQLQWAPLNGISRFHCTMLFLLDWLDWQQTVKLTSLLKSLGQKDDKVAQLLSFKRVLIDNIR